MVFVGLFQIFAVSFELRRCVIRIIRPCVCLFMHDPRKPHLTLIKRILRYLKGTLSSELHIGTSPVQSLTAYSDTDWACCLDSRRSTFGFCVYLSDNLVSWSSKRQTMVSRSSAEVEYQAMAYAVAECCWLR
ncbi:uncharacterized mitochondrial protein AtMg00810-like [Setaria viridis]|uniref:uncharacterized mitochondrial protein AtMg00810-like n=1 Tax=Setaria viridis TaxID=4556 RepID=UPI001493B356|nr:uncharacterized mitochondrial protein AtMg00810-like [Setaria viridis]